MTTFSAVVLAGGASRRFGSSKPGALFLGRPMLQWVVEAAAAVVDEIAVVAAPGQELPGLVATIPLRRVDDAVAFEGPLSGLRTGLPEVTGDWVFVLGCDMPLLTSSTLSALARMRDDHDAVMPRPGGRWQPLAALYHRAALKSAADQAWNEGKHSLHAIIDRLRVVDPAVVDPAWDRTNSAETRSANTPAELAELEAWAREHRAGALGLRTHGHGGSSIGS